jgi:hypothetical protein
MGRFLSGARKGKERRMTLEEKVYAVVSTEHAVGIQGPLEAIAEYPRDGGGRLSQFERDCRDWGLVFGVAYGIARGEDPFEREDSVTSRALAAAGGAFRRWVWWFDLHR